MDLDSAAIPQHTGIPLNAYSPRMGIPLVWGQIYLTQRGPSLWFDSYANKSSSSIHATSKPAAGVRCPLLPLTNLPPMAVTPPQSDDAACDDAAGCAACQPAATIASVG